MRSEIFKILTEFEANAKYMLAKPCSPEDHILEVYGDIRDRRILMLTKALRVAIDGIYTQDGMIGSRELKRCLIEIESILKEKK